MEVELRIVHLVHYLVVKVPRMKAAFPLEIFLVVDLQSEADLFLVVEPRIEVHSPM